MEGTGKYLYNMYGLGLVAPFQVPELQQSSNRAKAPDIRICLNRINLPTRPDSKIGKWFSKDGNDCYLNFPRVGKFLISNGTSIAIDPNPGVPVSDVRSILLGSAMATVLYQRGFLPLHVSGVVIENRAWAFSGPSGAGKSTLSAWLTQKLGLPTFSDDIACLDYLREEPVMIAGSNRVKLWKDALNQLSIDDNGLLRDMARFNKFHLIPKAAHNNDPLPLEKLIFLSRSKDGRTTLRERRGAKAIAYAASAAYQPAMGVQILGDEQMFRHATRLARNCAIYDFKRPWDYRHFDAAIESLFEKEHEIQV